ncbi:hypothetical protein EMIT0P74_70216 [Pseudomonas sp. IT-P74]
MDKVFAILCKLRSPCLSDLWLKNDQLARGSMLLDKSRFIFGFCEENLRSFHSCPQ